MTTTNCTVCGWPQIRRAGGHAWWCAQTRALLTFGYPIDWADVERRRASRERWHTIAASYGCASSTLEAKYRDWRRSREAVA